MHSDPPKNHKMRNTGMQVCNSSLNSEEACNFIKNEALAQVFSCEFCEISKNTFFHRTPLNDFFFEFVE